MAVSKLSPKARIVRKITRLEARNTRAAGLMAKRTAKLKDLKSKLSRIK